MLYPARVAQQLVDSVDRFRAFAESETAAFLAFGRAIALLDSLDLSLVAARLAEVPRPGALPSEEWDRPGPLVVPFPARFAHHRAAREWAAERLAGVTTVAVDGSEIKPTKDYSLPVAAVQVAWFENPHLPDGHYVKDVAFRLVHPDELIRESSEGFGHADQSLALHRFHLEVDKLIEQMEVLATRGWAGSPPVVFFDGSLVVSFAAQMLETLGVEYIQGVCRMLHTSERTGIPIVGFVDTSLAKDVATMLAALAGLPSSQRVADARLLDPHLAWGDRTRALVCARDDVLGRYQTPDGRDFGREICFVYLRTNREAAPARLDVPRWIVRRGLLEHVVDVVRAEVIVGNGYPYCIETADACAVLGGTDREHFYRLLQDFAGRQGLGLRIVPKAASKRRRRA